MRTHARQLEENLPPRAKGARVQKSSIEWTETTWNPVTGCSKVSPGCAHCYAETFAERWRGVPGHHRGLQSLD